MVNKEGLKQIKKEATELYKKAYDSFNTDSRHLLNADPKNTQIKIRLKDIMIELDILAKSKDLILSVEDGLETETKGIEEELSNMRNNCENIIQRLKEAEKIIKKNK